MSERDQTIDFGKGLCILWVINIHTVFWSGESYLPDSLQNLTLWFDVPFFFFTGGLVLRDSRQGTGIGPRLASGLRLYTQYVAFRLLVLIGVATTLRGSIVPEVWDDVLRALVVDASSGGIVGSKFPVLTGSFWFLYVHFGLLLLVVPLLGLLRSRDSRMLFALGLGLTTWLWHADLRNYSPIAGGRLQYTLDYVLPYSLFLMFGVLSRELGLSRREGAGLLVLLGLAIAVLGLRSGWAFPLQSGKFPPQPAYLLCCLAAPALFLATRPAIASGLAKWPVAAASFCWCGQHSFAIFLAQGVVCTTSLWYVDSLLAATNPVVAYLTALVANIAGSLLLAALWIFLLKTVLADPGTDLAPVSTFKSEGA